MSYKLKASIYEIDDEKGSLREEGTFDGLFKFGLISAKPEPGSMSDGTIFELTKEDLGGKTSLVSVVDGVDVVVTKVKRSDGKILLNPFLSLETGDMTYGVYRLQEADSQAGYFRITRDPVPDSLLNVIPDYVPVSNFDKDGSVDGLQLFAKADYKPSLKTADGRRIAKTQSQASMTMLGGLVLAGLISRNQTPGASSRGNGSSLQSSDFSQRRARLLNQENDQVINDNQENEMSSAFANRYKRLMYS